MKNLGVLLAIGGVGAFLYMKNKKSKTAILPTTALPPVDGEIDEEVVNPILNPVIDSPEPKKGKKSDSRSLKSPKLKSKAEILAPTPRIAKKITKRKEGGKLSRNESYLLMLARKKARTELLKKEGVEVKKAPRGKKKFDKRNPKYILKKKKGMPTEDFLGLQPSRRKSKSKNK